MNPGEKSTRLENVVDAIVGNRTAPASRVTYFSMSSVRLKCVMIPVLMNSAENLRVAKQLLLQYTVAVVAYLKLISCRI